VKISKLIKVNNIRGIHLRPSAMIASTASQYKSKMMIFLGDRVLDAKSILEVASMAAPRDTMLEIVADGDDAKEAIDAVSDILEKEFNFPNEADE